MLDCAGKLREGEDRDVEVACERIGLQAERVQCARVGLDLGLQSDALRRVRRCALTEHLVCARALARQQLQPRLQQRAVLQERIATRLVSADLRKTFKRNLLDHALHDLLAQIVLRLAAESHLMIVEPIDGDTDCKIRIAGEVMRKRYGRDVKDAQFSELFSPAVFRDNMMRLREVRRTGVPIIFDATVVPDDSPAFSYEVVLLRALAPDERTYWNIVGIFMLDA